MNDSDKIDKMINEMKIQLTDKVDYFHYSKIAKIPFKVHSFIEIMNLRMIDFSESAQTLLKNNQVVPAIPLIRSLFENVAITNRIVYAIESSLSNNKLIDNFDDLITKIKFGTRYNEEIVSINVLTQIDKLDKQFKGLRKYYDSLCEFTHPNWDGVEGSYSELDEINRCTYVQKIISKEHSLTRFFQTCFLLIISIFSGSAEWLRKNYLNLQSYVNHKYKKMDEDLIYQDFEYANNIKLGKTTGQKIIKAIKARNINEIRRLLSLPVEKGGLILLRLTEKDASGKTAKDYAIESGKNEIIELFK